MAIKCIILGAAKQLETTSAIPFRMTWTYQRNRFNCGDKAISLCGSWVRALHLCVILWLKIRGVTAPSTANRNYSLLEMSGGASLLLNIPASNPTKWTWNFRFTFFHRHPIQLSHSFRIQRDHTECCPPQIELNTKARHLAQHSSAQLLWNEQRNSERQKNRKRFSKCIQILSVAESANAELEHSCACMSMMPFRLINIFFSALHCYCSSFLRSSRFSLILFLQFRQLQR